MISRRVSGGLSAVAAIGAFFVLASVASAEPVCTKVKDETTCVDTQVVEETVFEETKETVFRVTQETVFRQTAETIFRETEETVFRQRPTTGPCTVGRSHRLGTAEGIATDEFLVTTTKEFLVTTTKEFLVTTTKEFLVTTTDEVLVTTTKQVTTVYKGNPAAGKILSGPTTEILSVTREVVDTVVEEELVDTVVEEELVDTVVEEELVDTVVEEELVGTTFTATGKCKNVAGQQPRV